MSIVCIVTIISLVQLNSEKIFATIPVTVKSVMLGTKIMSTPRFLIGITGYSSSVDSTNNNNGFTELTNINNWYGETLGGYKYVKVDPANVNKTINPPTLNYANYVVADGSTYYLDIPIQMRNIYMSIPPDLVFLTLDVTSSAVSKPLDSTPAASFTPSFHFYLTKDDAGNVSKGTSLKIGTNCTGGCDVTPIDGTVLLPGLVKKVGDTPDFFLRTQVTPPVDAPGGNYKGVFNFTVSYNY